MRSEVAAKSWSDLFSVIVRAFFQTSDKICGKSPISKRLFVISRILKLWFAASFLVEFLFNILHMALT